MEPTGTVGGCVSTEVGEMEVDVELQANEVNINKIAKISFRLIR